MARIKLRYQQISDAQRFFEILSNPNFVFITANPKSVEEEVEWLSQNPKRRQNNTDWNYAILYNQLVVGSVGIKIDCHRPYTGEIGYFIDEAYWNKGITTEAVKLAEKIGFSKRGLKRIEIRMEPENIASERVAVKCGYQKEGLLKKAVPGRDGQLKDVLLYAKTVNH
ncbi:MAG: GNAT family N-acetyltransferase [Bacteroidales bacterium]|nr:GNAT family N-acetyltransferase [Bacteroidales bacterium]